MRDALEPMLEGVPFDIVEGDDVHHRITDVDGLIRICFGHGSSVVIRELPRQTGGVWYVTTPYNEAQVLGCSSRDLWIGNARIAIPRTGLGRHAGRFGGPGHARNQAPMRM